MKTLSRILIGMWLLAGLLGATPALSLFGAYAGTTVANFDDSDPLEDLKSGEGFDILQYPFDEARNVKILNVAEYCYSYKVNMQRNYGLYLYVYNPRGIVFDTVNAGNKVQMAVGWNADGTPAAYEKFGLKFCSRSEATDYLGLFYKFKVVDHVSERDGKTILQRLNSSDRRYDISGVELAAKGEGNAVEYTVGGTYRFTGYSKGYGSDPSAESTLTCTVNDLETVRLDVRHAYWRDGNRASADQNQLDTAYFAVPNRLLEEYGRLQKVKCEWYEYRTAPIVFVNQDELYNGLKPLMGKVLSGGYDGSNVYGLAAEYKAIGSPAAIAMDWYYNLNPGNFHAPFPTTAERADQLCLLFYEENADVTKYEITSETLRESILSYDLSAEAGYLPIKNGKVSADLFTADAGPGRTRGYNSLEVDSDTRFDMLASDDRNWWDRFWGRNDPSGSSFHDVPPIAEVPSGSLDAGALFVSENQIGGIEAYRDAARGFINSETQLPEPGTTFLIRYAVTNYWSKYLTGFKGGQFISVPQRNIGYVAQENVFLDFDVIELTFNREGKYHVIAAVANPIDAIGGITPPVDTEGCQTVNWTLIVSIALILLLFWLLRPLLSPLLGAVGEGILWLIKLPFRLIAWPFRAIAGRKHKGDSKSK